MSQPARLSIAPARTLVFGNATIQDTARLITDPAGGKYSRRTQPVRDMERALALACDLWGGDTPWSDIHEAHYTALLRFRVEELVAKGCRAVRTAEVTVSRLITAVGWMREERHILRDAAPWPRRWKLMIREHWKSVVGTQREPEPHRPRHTLEDAHKILAAANFDPRLDLMLKVGFGLRLGQVARCMRSDLELPVVGWDAPETNETDYGTLVVQGAGKKRGTTVDLTRGQRRSVDDALAAGYLAKVEARRVAGEVTDYCLFAAGYVVGRVGFTRNKNVSRYMSDKAVKRGVCARH